MIPFLQPGDETILVPLVLVRCETELIHFNIWCEKQSLLVRTEICMVQFLWWVCEHLQVQLKKMTVDQWRQVLLVRTRMELCCEEHNLKHFMLYSVLVGSIIFIKYFGGAAMCKSFYSVVKVRKRRRCNRGRVLVQMSCSCTSRLWWFTKNLC